MRLEEGKIALRPPTESDVPALVEACRDPEIARWTSVPSPYGEEDARAFVRGADGVDVFLVVDAASDELLGTVGVGRARDGRGICGYWTKREARGRGVASRALRLLAEWALRGQGLARLELFVEPANEPSIRVAERAGFSREGLLRSYVELKGTRRDVYVYSLLRGEL